MIKSLGILSLTAAILTMLSMSPVAADDLDVVGSPDRPDVIIGGDRVVPSDGSSGSGGSGESTDVYVPPPLSLDQTNCRVDAESGIYGCPEDNDPEADEDELTEGDILTAARRIGLPRLNINIQPGGRTLVNARTIFYANPPQWAHSVDLLGFDVDLAATPTNYTWHHGDGTSHSTSQAGRPYPAFDVTHRYKKSADKVTPSVDVTYQVRYRVDGGPWQNLSQILTAAGPAAELEVREAAPVLAKP